jgi:hypothetical protein
MCSMSGTLHRLRTEPVFFRPSTVYGRAEAEEDDDGSL